MEGFDRDELFPAAARARRYGQTPRPEQVSSVPSSEEHHVPPPIPDAPTSPSAPVNGDDPPSHDRTNISPALSAVDTTEDVPCRIDDTSDDSRSASDGPVSRGTAPPLARSGWQGRVNRLTRGALRLSPGRREVDEARLEQTLRQPFDLARTIVVANPAPGAAKTTTALMLTATLGEARGGHIVVWDDTEARGDLGRRVMAAEHGRAVVDLVCEADQLLSGDLDHRRLTGFMHPQGTYDVLASTGSSRLDVIHPAAFTQVHTLLTRRYPMIVIDTGNAIREPNWTMAIGHANCLVVPTIVDSNTGNVGLDTLDHLIRVGQGDLVRRAVVVISCADPTVDRRVLQQAIRYYQQLARALVVVPFDEHVRLGRPVTLDGLAEPTRRAWRQASAIVVRSLGGGSII